MKILNKSIQKTLSDLHWLKSRKAHRLLQETRKRKKIKLTDILITICNNEEIAAKYHADIYKKIK
jgi:hypothetical protein